jgi:hypothetical protein
MSESRKERSKTILDYRRLMLSAPLDKGKGGAGGKKIWSTLRVDVFSNMPWITVYTNDPDDQKNDDGRIKARISPLEFAAMLLDLENMIGESAGEDKERALVNFDPDSPRGEERQKQSAFRYGKNKNGIVWVGLYMPKRPFIRFEFRFSQFHALQHKGGEQFSEAEASQLFARGWVQLIRQYVVDLMRTGYEHWQPDSDGKKNRGGSSSSSRNSYPEMEDDDIPM